MSNDAEKVLQALYDEFTRTGDIDYCGAAALSNLPHDKANPVIVRLETAGYVKRNVLGEVKLTEFGISYFE